MAVIGKMREFAEPRLRNLCAQHHWLFDDRVKGVESALVKLEMGRTSSLRGLIDLYATMVVVPTAAHIDLAVAAVLDSFDGTVKQRPPRPPDSFPYDDVHIHAYLGTKVSPPAMLEVVRLRVFEIQVRTGLQYAWWRATHDTTYKGAIKDPATQRLAGQTRATLELLDSLLADIPKAAELQLIGYADEPAPTPPSANWLQLWAEDRRPDDVGRFCETIDAILSAADVDAEMVGSALTDGTHDVLLNSDQLTPTQAIVVVVDELAAPGWTERLALVGRRLMVTAEMLAVRPELDQVPVAHRVEL